MPLWFWVLPFQGMPALVARLRLDVVTVFNLLWWHQLPGRTWMPRLSPALAFAVLGWLVRLRRNIRSVARRRLGRVARVAIDPLTQGSQLCFQFLHPDE
jgi:hypothetical protein